jgi:hypothetical protein
LEIQGENKRGYYRFYRRGVFVGYDIPVPAYTTNRVSDGDFVNVASL